MEGMAGGVEERETGKQEQAGEGEIVWVEQDLLLELEERVRQAIDLIRSLRQENGQLRDEIERLRNEIEARDEKIAELEGRVQQLLHFADEIERFKRQRREIIEKLRSIISVLEGASEER